MKRSSERGQVLTQNVVLAGILVTVTIAILSVIFLPVRLSFIDIATCIISDVCKDGRDGPTPLVPNRPKCAPTTRDRTVCERIAGTSECGGLCKPWKPSRSGCVTVSWNGWLPKVEYSACYQNDRARAARHACCVCGLEDECDGSTTTTKNDKVLCINNDTAGAVLDIEETRALVLDNNRLIAGQPPEITENDSVKSTRKGILDALSMHGPPNRIELVAHSEGSVVLAHALWELANEGKLTPEDLGRLEVVVAGPAEWRFPKGVSVTAYAAYNKWVPVADPVPWLTEVLKSEVDRNRVETLRLEWIGVDNGCFECHKFLSNYIDEVAYRPHDDSGPVFSVLINGIRNTFDEWNGDGGVCEQYAKKRYGG